MGQRPGIGDVNGFSGIQSFIVDIGNLNRTGVSTDAATQAGGGETNLALRRIRT